MMLSRDEARILREVVGGIPEVAKKVAAIHAHQQATALQALERHYQKIMLEAGSSGSDARRWVDAVMDRIRRQVAEHDQKRSLTVLQKELAALAEQNERSQSASRNVSHVQAKGSQLASGNVSHVQAKVHFSSQPRFANLDLFDPKVVSRVLNPVKKLAINSAIIRDFRATKELASDLGRAIARDFRATKALASLVLGRAIVRDFMATKELASHVLGRARLRLKI